jgi:hypothetical protein
MKEKQNKRVGKELQMRRRDEGNVVTDESQ